MKFAYYVGGYMNKKEGFMNKKKISLLVFFSLFLFPSFLLADKQYEYVGSPEEDIYFGHISWTDVKYDGMDPVVLRDGERLPSIAVLNFPLTAGDTIKTTEARRCEIQFDTGTIIRLDYDTELKIETILAQSLSSRDKLTNLVLNKGQIYIMYKNYNSREAFQVLTVNAAVKMKHRTVATVEASADGDTVVKVKLGKAYLLYGADEDHLKKEKIKKRQNAIVSQDHKLIFARYKPDTAFELWNVEMNANFQKLHQGKSFIPAPIEKFPNAIIGFAQKYSNRYGEWMWNSLYGFVWRPSYNDYYPWGPSWRPYFYGQWREVNGQLFWVPEERWGWVPYHLGLWTWDQKYGWVWIPALSFAPAWVSWSWMMGYYTWRPWSVMDWCYPLSYYDSPFSSYYYYFGHYRWRRYLYDREEGLPNYVRHWITKDQLKKKSPSHYSLPKNLEKTYKNMVKALQREDERVISALENLPQQLIAVKKGDLNAAKIQEKNVKLSDFAKHLKSPSFEEQVFPDNLPANPYSRAALTFRQNREISELEAYVIPSSQRTQLSISQRMETPGFVDRVWTDDRTEKFAPFQIKSEQGHKTDVVSPKLMDIRRSMRIRDWNPDVRVARRMGVGITYSSRDNEVQCPELGITSRNVIVSRFGKSSVGGFYFSGTGGTTSSGSSSGSSSRSRGNSAGHSRSGGHSGSRGTKK